MIPRAACMRAGRRLLGRIHAPSNIAGVVGVFVAAVGTAGAQAPSRAAASAALARAGDAVVTILAYRDGSDDVVGSGTGVRMTDGRVVTALRHLRGASRVVVFGADGDSLATVTTLDQAEVKLDLAVLPRITGTTATMTLARRSALLAQKVSVLGPKKGTTRSVSARTISHVEPDDNGRPLLRLGAPVSGSAVGSPVVNARSELVGIAVGSLPGRDEGDVAVDVAALRELLGRPTARLAFPTRDGALAAARAPGADPKASASNSASKPPDASVRPRSAASIFPEVYPNPVSADTVGSVGVALYGCARFESRKKVYCYLLLTNLAGGRTVSVAGGDLADSTRRKVREAENLVLGETSQKVAGWRAKANVPLRELESVKVALEFTPPERDTDAVRLVLDISGERTLFLGPFVLQRVP